MADQANSGEETSLTFSKEELQSMIESVVKQIVPQIVSKTVNGAMTDRQDKFEQKMLEQVKSVMGVKDETAPAKNKKNIDPELAGQIDELKAFKEKAEAREAQFRDRELRRLVSEDLEFVGLDKTKRKALAAQLILEDKLVGYSENDPEKVVFKHDGIELPLRQGLTTKFFASEEGKSWLPPKNIQGSGSKPVKPALPEFDRDQQATNALKKLF